MKRFIVVMVLCTAVVGSLIVAVHFNRIPTRLHSTMDDEERAHTEDTKKLAAAVENIVTAPHETRYLVASDTPQFVLLSFDGSKSTSMLEETIDFAHRLTQEGTPLHFTYFINAVYFLTPSTKFDYQPPKHKPGTSNIGFSDSAQDIAIRVKDFNEAIQEGNEIGSHSAGHFDGTDWSYVDWKQEFDEFDKVIFNTQAYNSTVTIEPWVITQQDIVGFRAPELGINDNLYKVLHDEGFLYDASGVGFAALWPKKDSYGLWHIPLGTIYVGPHHRPAVAMDFSLWMHQSQAKNTVVKGSEAWNNDLQELRAAYMDYFTSNYNGTRAPVVIANHFSQWNDGLYWEAMKSFAQEVCGKPNVHCVTFKELVHYLNTKGVPTIARR